MRNLLLFSEEYDALKGQIREILQAGCKDTHQYLDTLRWLEPVQTECMAALADEAGTIEKFKKLRPFEIEVRHFSS